MPDNSNFDPASSGASQFRDKDKGQQVVPWIMTRVSAWEDHRAQNFDTKWEEYYRLWRGIWRKEDRTRDSERSKLISPALMQAVEASVSELEEAVFGRGRWFDVSDDVLDAQPEDIAMWRDQLAEDMDKARVPDAISEVFLNGAIYGTGIGKIFLEEVTEKEVVASPIGETDITEPDVRNEQTVRVGMIAVHPKEFVIDPAARTIDEALGCAHITVVPKHTVEQKQEEGIYRDFPLSAFTDTIVGERFFREKEELRNIHQQEQTLIIEYHGLAPRKMIEELDEDEDVVSLFDDKDEKRDGDGELVEVIVTIANGSQLLRAVKNPHMMKDRGFIAYQHDTVPNQFWGRGIAEKGYNPQKALDAELRGRVDAMTLSIHPMMAIDATRIQRGANFRVAPGRTVFTQGNPKDVLMPFNFGQVNNNTFNQSADLERQVQMGTGSMDSATPIGENRRNETSGGMSMIMGGAIKRSKRTLANIERNFIDPFINKSAWRYMQFAPDRYPALDIKFNVDSTLGIMAREIQSQQISGFLNTLPPDSPAFWMMIKELYEHSTLTNREEMLPIIDQMMQQSIQQQSQPEPQDPAVELKTQELQLKAQMDQAKLALEQDENNTKAQLEVAKLQLREREIALKQEEMLMDAKIELAKMEQDSQVTIAQMSQKEAEIRNKSFESANKPAQAAPAQPQGPIPVIVNPTQAPKKKRISVKKTADGSFEGVSEELPVDPTKTRISVNRSADGSFEGLSEEIE